ncbi:T9SS type A sorting domain-containing protein [Pseudochryseolinea flava]|uniref:Secretion system C-terminal sorting domain-containing protein n=1 Tax=Pseudochryseolinea flava TaxID=2059302 RepID=A0A364Y5D7_9BACT|nr:T9SS type A sorting domain-containing protein [Pseudochryseolinea flava]RAW01281.1 hypothetical protein DQQ10_10245 [Pseudochryseolinea flava]
MLTFRFEYDHGGIAARCGRNSFTIIPLTVTFSNWEALSFDSIFWSDFENIRMKKLSLALILFTLSLHLHAQVNTIKAGTWDDPTVWSTGVSPTSTAGVITLNHAVTIPNGYAVTVDEVIANAALTIANGGSLSLSNGAGTDLLINPGNTLVVNGEFIMGNLATVTQTGATVTFGAASTYRHRYTATEGIPLVATWATTSNFIIEGYTNLSILNFTSTAWSQTYGNFVYNCTLQRSTVNFNGLITDVNGDFSVLSTGTSFTQLTIGQSNVAFDVDGNFSIAGTARFNFSTTSAGGVLDIGGNFNFTSTNVNGSLLTNIGSFTINLAGDFNMNAPGGRIFMAGSSGSTGTSTFNLNGNFNLTSGQITESGGSTASGNLRFLRAGATTFVNTGSVINRINYYISAATILDVSIYPLSSSGANFILDGTLIVGSTEPTGAIRNSTTLGNIRTTNTLRVFSPGSMIIYRSASAQFMGDGQPATADVTTVIDNPNGVSLFQGTTAQMTIAGHLELRSGQLFIGNRRLNLNGTISSIGGVLGGDGNSVVVVGGTSGGNFGTLPFGVSNNVLGVLTLNRTGAGAAIGINSAVTITSQLNLVNGDANNASGLTLAAGATVSRWPTAQLLGARALHGPTDAFNVIYRTTSVAGSPATFSTGLELPSPSELNALGSLTINTNQSTDILQLSQDLTINGVVTFTRGVLQGSTHAIRMRGASWIDNAGNFIPGTSTVTFDGTTAISGTSTAVFANIAATNTASLSTVVNLNVSGNIAFATGSTFAPSTTTTILNGAALQTVSAGGSNFFNLTISKSGGNVQLTGPTGLIGYLNFVSPTANCNFQSNGFLTLISTSDAEGTATAPGTSQIYRLGTNTVTGDVTVQRFMSGEGRIYRYISSPVTNATVASWQDDFPITGTFSNPSNGSASCGFSFIKTQPSLYYYDETPPGNVDQGYVAYPTVGISASNPLVVGRGYAAFIRRCDSPTIIDVTGPINQGTFTYSLTYTNTGDATADGYNLIGNPYPCTIDWDMGWAKTRISPIISVRDNGAGGMMRYWDGTSGDLTNGRIAQGQAFWVRATAANPVLRITENAKVITANTAGEFYREDTTPPTPIVVSTLPILLSDGVLTDKAFVKLRSESQNTLDDLDAPKLDNEAFDLYTLSDDKVAMAINARHSVDNDLIIALGIRDLEARQYTLSLGERNGDFDDYSYYLIDQYTNTIVSLDKPYTFTITNDPATARTDRFKIQLKSESEASAIVAYPNPVERYMYVKVANFEGTTVSITDNLGQTKSMNVQRNSGMLMVDFEGMPAGIYFLNMFVTQTGRSTLKIIKK